MPTPSGVAEKRAAGRAPSVLRQVEQLQQMDPSTTAHTCSKLSPANPALTIGREDGAVVVHIPVNFRRRNGRQMILTCDGQQHPARQDRTVNSTLVSALAKAYHWQEQLESGQYASLEELAAANGVDRSYVGRILRLTSLSPEIVEAIVDGNEPKGLTLAKLRKKLPLIWAEQKWD